MVLAELGGRISRAIQAMNRVTVIDEKALNECLNEITRALLQADVSFKMVMGLQQNIKRIVNLEELAAGHNKRIIIEKAIFNELCNMLDPNTTPLDSAGGRGVAIMKSPFSRFSLNSFPPSSVPPPRRCTVLSYTETDPAKIAQEGVAIMKEGPHPDPRSQCFPLLSPPTIHCRTPPLLHCSTVPSYTETDPAKIAQEGVAIMKKEGYTETDPAKIAQEGVAIMKKEGCDLIIIDTSGRHKQEASLFEEMRQVSELTNPDLVLFVMDSSIGQAAYDQAQAFKASVPVGAVIITKMDGHAKGGGALSAVAATKSPVIFIGTGEHIDEFEQFETKAFVSRLLGTQGVVGERG
ncbi:unnamed protein product [Closterium sp. NIES-54]